MLTGVSKVFPSFLLSSSSAGSSSLFLLLSSLVPLLFVFSLAHCWPRLPFFPGRPVCIVPVCLFSCYSSICVLLQSATVSPFCFLDLWLDNLSLSLLCSGPLWPCALLWPSLFLLCSALIRLPFLSASLSPPPTTARRLFSAARASQLGPCSERESSPLLLPDPCRPWTACLVCRLLKHTSHSVSSTILSFLNSRSKH